MKLTCYCGKTISVKDRFGRSVACFCLLCQFFECSECNARGSRLHRHKSKKV
jgi:hypothetical protein